MTDLRKLLDEAISSGEMVETRYKGYFVDRAGTLWSTSNWRGLGIRKLSLHQNSHGYLTAKAATGGGMKKIIVHAEVCRAFHGEKPFPEAQVRHLNGARGDNRAENLSWGSAKDNADDRAAHGRTVNTGGGRVVAAKRSIPVLATFPDGSSRLFSSMMEAKRNGFRVGPISSCLRGKFSQHGGATWSRATLTEVRKLTGAK